MMLDKMTNDTAVAAGSHGPNPDEDTDGYIDYSDRLETYIVPVVFGLIFLVGVVGNGCLIYILCRHKTMRSVPNTFIFNLALGDLLVLLCSVPFTSTVYTLDSWPYGEFVCKASEFAKDTSVGVSVFTLTALSLDRYTAIVRPVQSFVGGPKSKLVIVCLLLIWITSLGLALPAALFSHLLKVNVPPLPTAGQQTKSVNGTLIAPTYREIFVCYPFPEEFGPFYPKAVVLVRFLAHYCLPLLIIGTFYAIMAHHLLRSVRTIPGQATLSTMSTTSSSTTQRHRHPATQDVLSNKTEPSLLQQQQQQPNQNRARRKVAKMVLSFVVLFAVCFLPMHVYMLWFYFDPDSQANYNAFWNALKIVGFVLAYINSCINPIALYCVSTSFRKHFNRLLCCCGDQSGEGTTVSIGGGGGSTFGANGLVGREDGLMDEPVSTAISQYNSRRHVVVTAGHSRSFKAPNNVAAARRNPVQTVAEDEESYPLNEFTRQQHQSLTQLQQTKSIC